MNAVTSCTLLLAFFFILGSGVVSVVTAQECKVANYSFGKAGTKGYERLSFWVEGGKRGEVVYSHGEEAREDTLTYVEAGVTNSAPGFKVRLSDGHVLRVIPKGLALQVVDEGGKDSRLFRWE